MSKRILAVLSLGLLVLVGVQWSDAGETGRFRIDQGYVMTDTLIWKASGNVPGSDVRVDTIIAGTLNDTTYGVDIAGCERLSVMFFSRNKTDNMSFVVTPQVSPDNGSYWNTLSTTFSVSNTAGGQVGGVADTGKDTLLWIPLYSTAQTAIVTAGTNSQRKVYLGTFADRAMIGASRFLRFHLNPGASSGDSAFVHAVITKVYPAR